MVKKIQGRVRGDSSSRALQAGARHSCRRRQVVKQAGR